MAQNEDNTKQIVIDQFNSLPLSIQQAITKSNWEESIRNIVKKYNLHIDQGTSLENQTLMTMLGFDSPENFLKNIEEHSRIPHAVAVNITRDVEAQVFQKIIDALVESTGETGELGELAGKSIPTDQNHTDNVDNIDDTVDRDNLLKEIEDPVPTKVSVKEMMANPEIKAPESPVQVPEIPVQAPEVPIQMPQTEVQPIAQEPMAPNTFVSSDNFVPDNATPVTPDTLVPDNLPVGNISDVPPHGHDHTEEVVPVIQQAPVQQIPVQEVPVVPQTPVQQAPYIAPAPINESIPPADTFQPTDAYRPADASNIIDQKLSETTFINKEVITNDETLDTPTSKQPLGGQIPQRPKTDPYREPIE